MNQAHLHLIVNHFPIMGTAVGILVLIGGYIVKNQMVKNTALGIFILSCLGILAAHFTGEGAEDVVEDMPGISRKLIHHHEHFASTFGWCLLAVALLSLVAIYFEIKNKPYSKILHILILVSAFITLFFAQQTATSGGEIRHTEIRDAATNAAPVQDGQEQNEKDEH